MTDNRQTDTQNPTVRYTDSQPDVFYIILIRTVFLNPARNPFLTI